MNRRHRPEGRDPGADPVGPAIAPAAPLGARGHRVAKDDAQGLDPQALETLVRQMEGRYPHVAELAQAVYHDQASVVGQGCVDQFEFEFALDLLLNGLDKLR